MTKKELLDRLEGIVSDKSIPNEPYRKLDKLIEDIKLDGILDVQIPDGQVKTDFIKDTQ